MSNVLLQVLCDFYGGSFHASNEHIQAIRACHAGYPKQHLCWYSDPFNVGNSWPHRERECIIYIVPKPGHTTCSRDEVTDGIENMTRPRRALSVVLIHCACVPWEASFNQLEVVPESRCTISKIFCWKDCNQNRAYKTEPLGEAVLLHPLQT